MSEIPYSPAGWCNLPTAKEGSHISLERRSENESKDHRRILDTWEESRHAVGSNDIVLNKLGWITKSKPDGSTEQRGQ